MNAAVTYVTMLAEIYREVDGEGGMSKSWNMLRDALKMDDDGNCTVNVYALNDKALMYVVYEIEHTDSIRETQLIRGFVDQGESKDLFNPIGDWSQFCEFMQRHHDLQNAPIDEYSDPRIAVNILRAYIVSMLGLEVEVPFKML